MKSLIVYCSKTGNTEKVARRIAAGLGGESRLVRLDLSPEGILREFQPTFTLDAGPYDLIVFGAWVMVMKVHPFLANYLRSCKNLEGKKVAVFLTGGAIYSKNHAYEDMMHLLEERRVALIDFSYTTTLLGLTLTEKKLMKAEAFARSLRNKVEEGA
jgi:flavodoxin